MIRVARPRITLLLLATLAGALGISSARGDVVNLGVLGVESLIPRVPGDPGVVVVSIDNLTGLPPDFYSNPIDFTNVNVILALPDHSVIDCKLGTISSLDTNTDCQVPDTTPIVSILATGDFVAFTTAEGRVFGDFRTQLDPVNTLAVIAVGASVPEPTDITFLLVGLPFTVAFIRRTRRRSISIWR